MNLKLISLDRLHPHPDNANRMPDQFFEKLIAHIRESRRYPPLIVRAHPDRAEHYQILDGHHRACALRRLGHDHARCDVWSVDDDQATMLLLTLNRLQGEDDPARRGALLRQLAARDPVHVLHTRLPDAKAQIERLIERSDPPPRPVSPRAADDLPRAITFFLSPRDHRALLEKLASVSRDRNRALVALLGLKLRPEANSSDVAGAPRAI